MLKYSPPKAKLWGHQVSRHSATEVLQLCQQFVTQFCNLLPPPPFPSEQQLLLVWPKSSEAQVAPLIGELEALLGVPLEANDLPLGPPMRMQTWKYCEEQVPSLAELYDRYATVFKKGKINYAAGWGCFFTWRDDPSPDPLGGSFSCYITSPLTVGTHFAFRDFKHYEEIKQYLQQIGLLELSEKHLTPKALVKEYLAGKK